MRDILFRGKISNGQWLYGDLIQRDNKCYIVYDGDPDSIDNYEVDIATVGQFIGEFDALNRRIFENDKLCFGSLIFTVRFKNGAFSLVTNWGNILSGIEFRECKIYGNIHE
jgi:hypothetical protein